MTAAPRKSLKKYIISKIRLKGMQNTPPRKKAVIVEVSSGEEDEVVVYRVDGKDYGSSPFVQPKVVQPKVRVAPSGCPHPPHAEAHVQVDVEGDFRAPSEVRVAPSGCPHPHQMEVDAEAVVDAPHPVFGAPVPRCSRQDDVALRAFSSRPLKPFLT